MLGSRIGRPGALAALLVAAPLAAPLAAQTPPATQAPPPVTLRLQSFSVIVPDYDEAKRWYTETLGFVTVRDQAFGATGERFILVAPPGQPEVGIVLQRARAAPSAEEPSMPTDYSDRIGKTVNVVLRVSDLAAYAEALRARGVAFTSPPRRMPWGGQATFADLYGNSFVLVGPLGAAGAAR